MYLHGVPSVARFRSTRLRIDIQHLATPIANASFGALGFLQSSASSARSSSHAWSFSWTALTALRCSRNGAESDSGSMVMRTLVILPPLAERSLREKLLAVARGVSVRARNALEDLPWAVRNPSLLFARPLASGSILVFAKSPVAQGTHEGRTHNLGGLVKAQVRFFRGRPKAKPLRHVPTAHKQLVSAQEKSAGEELAQKAKKERGGAS